MTIAIILTVIAGVLAGYFFLPEVFVENTEHILTAGLCLLLFMVGIDIGRQGTVISDIRKNGLRILTVPLFVILGTLAGAAAAALLTGMALRDSAAVAAGLGW